MDDALTAEERAGVVKLMQESGIRMTGQNKVWLAECVLMRALLEGKAPDARAARDAIASEVALSKTVEGIQADWSFHQHGNTRGSVRRSGADQWTSVPSAVSSRRTRSV